MTISDEKLYEELNQRARAYAGQLWYVPFAFLGLAGAGVAVLDQLPSGLRGIMLIMLGFFSLGVLAHVSSIKFYERRAVKRMRELESPPASSGGSRFYLSYAWYVRILLAVLALGLVPLGAHLCWGEKGSVFAFLATVSWLIVMVARDWTRTKPLLNAIRHRASNQAANSNSAKSG